MLVALIDLLIGLKPPNCIFFRTDFRSIFGHSNAFHSRMPSHSSWNIGFFSRPKIEMEHDTKSLLQRNWAEWKEKSLEHSRCISGPHETIRKYWWKGSNMYYLTDTIVQTTINSCAVFELGLTPVSWRRGEYVHKYQYYVVMPVCPRVSEREGCCSVTERRTTHPMGNGRKYSWSSSAR